MLNLYEDRRGNTYYLTSDDYMLSGSSELQLLVENVTLPEYMQNEEIK